MLVNVFFFVFWVYKVYGEMRNTLLKRFSGIYLMFCFCGNKYKYDRALSRIKQNEENEKLKETFQNIFKDIETLRASGRLIVTKDTVDKLE